jgi:hypothetical protein
MRFSAWQAFGALDQRAALGSSGSPEVLEEVTKGTTPNWLI